MLLFIYLTFLLKFVASLDFQVDICGFPKNVTKCLLIDLICIDKLEYAARVFFNKPEAQDLILKKIDPLHLNSIEIHIQQYKVVLNNVEVKGILNSKHIASFRLDLTLGEDYYHSGSLSAQSLQIIDMKANERISSSNNVFLSFDNVHTQSSIAISPVKRCKEDIFFDFEGTGIYIKGGECRLPADFNVLTSKVNSKEVSDALCHQIGHKITEVLQQNLKLIHVSVAANRIWIFEPKSILKPVGDTSNSAGLVANVLSPFLEHRSRTIDEETIPENEDNNNNL